MASTIRKNIGKLGQWTGEKFGKEEKTEVSDQFKILLAETDNKRIGTENLHSALQLFIQHQAKKKDATDNSKTKTYILENLGHTMFQLGEVLPRDSLYGKALKSFGQAEDKICNLQSSFVSSTKDEWVVSLERQLDTFKEFLKLQKKFDNRRLDYDAKSNKFAKSKKDSSQIEDELRAAEVKYEDTFDEMVNRMMNFQDSETDGLQNLYRFYTAQLNFHRQSAQVLDNLGGFLKECMSSKRAPAKERLPVMRADTLKNSDYRNNTSPSRNYEDSGFYSSPQHNKYQSNHETSEKYFLESPTFNNNSGFESNNSHDQINYKSQPSIKAAQTLPSRRAPPPPPPPQKPARTPKEVLRKSLYDFIGADAGELTFKTGDIVEVVDIIDDGWWMGKIIESTNHHHIGKSGLFPVSYTEEYERKPSTRIERQHSSPILSTKSSLNLKSGISNVNDIHRVRSTPDNNNVDNFNQGNTAEYGQSEAYYKRDTTIVSNKPQLSTQGHPIPIRVTRNQTMPVSAGFGSPRVSSRQPSVFMENAIAEPPSSGQVGICTSCGCDDYSPNVFKKGSCNNCFHKH
ncbi:hypothetical protein BB559_001446 [Furculomyces boomerangus]|uniref:BAR-domain-containing protein n=2 Tax=Harpellales TaxID=61421 RepID=A0A2T9Z1W2_9FUNG|nr:hypothetical protein BB559_001446 [Furculomyces boomerangus]PWA03557.1 hypothetical protein BB558_000247 [Smittium angustum]